jgi:sugar lactone lactonase YvrE
VALLAVICASAFALTAAPAFAGLTHPFKSQLTGAPSGPFVSPKGVAVDPASQDVYVADLGNRRVEVFSSAGVYLSQITGASLPEGAKFRPQYVAVSDKTGDVYVGSFGEGAFDVVYVFNAVGGYVATITGPGTPEEESFSSVTGLAVDQSSGDVYVADGTLHTVVDRFASTGEYLSKLSFSAEPTGVATDSSGDLYVVESAGGGVYEFNSTGEQIGRIAGAPSGRVAVDSAGNVYVAGGGSAAEFDSSGVLVDETRTFVRASGAPNAHFGEAFGVAVNAAEDVYVSDANQGVVDVFAPNLLVPGVGGEPATGVSDNAASLHGAVNPEGTEVGLCVFEYRTAAEPEYGHHSAACSPSTPYTGTTNVPVEATPSNLEANTTYYYRLVASNANGSEGGPGYGPEESFRTLGAPRVEGLAAEVNATKKAGQTMATLRALVDPDGRETTYAFEYGETESYGTSIPIPAEAIGSGEAFVPVMAELTNLKIGTTYHYRVSATNEFGTVRSVDQTVATLPAVLIESESTSNVAATSATLEALIDPLGSSSTCEFQYVTDASFKSTGYGAAVRAPCPAGLGEGEVGVPTSVHVQSLTADTVYHYRAAATNDKLETSAGADRVFATQRTAETPVLPDGRQWEQVSPPHKYGALLAGPGYIGASEAAVGGDAVSYFAFGATELGPEGQAEAGQVLSTRGPAGWSSKDTASPHGEAVTKPQPSRPGEYLFFSEDLSRSLAEPRDTFKRFSAPMACTTTGCLPESFPEATGFTPLIRQNGTCASAPGSCYEPLLTGAAGYRDVRAGAEFGEPFPGDRHEEFAGAAPDLNSVVLASEAGLTPGAPKQKELYEWSAAASATERLRLVSVLPDGEGGGPVTGGGVFLGAQSSLPAAGGWRPVSADGSRVFWTGGGHLYLRDMAKGETLSIGGGTFQAASRDGSRVFFATAAGDLNLCEVVEESGKDACKSTDLTPGAGGLSTLMPGTSDDGSYVYFIAHGVLSSVANGGGEKAVPGAENLYMSRYDGTKWATTFVASLSAEDETDLGGGTLGAVTVGMLTARVSPNGRYLAFMSNRSLTGYDNHDALTGKPDEEVYLYDAGSGGVGSLICASCNPTGGRPHGVEVGQVVTGNFGSNYAGIMEPSGGPYGNATGIAANIPGGSAVESYRGAWYQPRYLSDTGRLFFNSSDALVPRDANGQEDVYEYEPVGFVDQEGKQGCTSKTVTFSERSNGCVDLISSGRSPGESGFVDASETGGDVFFMTGEQLVASDFDSSVDLYDAHECTAHAPCFPVPAASPPACTDGEACRAAPSPQPGIFGSPSSATFSGAGNVTSSVATKTTKCKTGFVKKKNKCVKKKSRKKPRKAKKASNSRGRA